MDLGTILLAPVRVPMRVAQALDDLSTLADRARREPDPVEEARDRLDALLLELAAVIGVAREIVDGGADLTRTARSLDVHVVELIAGGSRLTAVSEQLEGDLRVFRAALPRLLQGLEVVEDLEDAVETVAGTMEPLQGAAARVGRVTQKLSRG